MFFILSVLRLRSYCSGLELIDVSLIPFHLACIGPLFYMNCNYGIAYFLKGSSTYEKYVMDNKAIGLYEIVIAVDGIYLKQGASK